MLINSIRYLFCYVTKEFEEIFSISSSFCGGLSPLYEHTIHVDPYTLKLIVIVYLVRLVVIRTITLIQLNLIT